MNFEVGDKVRRIGGINTPYTVLEVGALGSQGAIFKCDGHPGENVWHRQDDYEKVERRKPTYRIYHNGHVVYASIAGRTTISLYWGATEAAKTVEEAEAAVRAAMGALGYEEEQA